MAVERHISRQFTQQGQDGPERHLLGVKRLQQSLQRQVDTLRGLDNVKFAAFDRERKVSLVHDYVFNPGARPAMGREVFEEFDDPMLRGCGPFHYQPQRLDQPSSVLHGLHPLKEGAQAKFFFLWIHIHSLLDFVE